MLTRKQVESGIAHSRPESRGVALEPLAQVIGLLQEVEHGQRRPHHRRRDRVREEVGPSPLLEHLNDLATGCDVASAGTPEGLAQRAGDDVDPVLDPEPRRRSPSAGTDEPDSV